MAGFGRAPFGRGPFGRSDTGTDLIISSFPPEYFDDSIVLDPGETLTDNDKDPLLQLLKTTAYQVFHRRLQVDLMPTLLDPEEMPLDLVRMWGDMLGLGIDRNDPEFLQRSFLANASQWLQIKASTKGYSVRGLASGFDVRVDNFWRIDEIYAPLMADRFKYLLRPVNSDTRALPILHTDQPPGTFPGTPTEEDETYAKSSYLRVVFSIHEPRKENVNYNILIDLVINKIRDVVGIHQEMMAPELLFIINVPTHLSCAIIEIDEFTPIPVAEDSRYDIVAADVQPTDSHLLPDVTIEIDEFFTVGAVASIDVSMEIDESEVDAIAEVDVDSSAIVEIDEFADIEVDETTITVDMVNGQLVFVEVDATFITAEIIFIAENWFTPIDVNGNVTPIIHESILDMPVEASDHFDLTPADVIPTDRQFVQIIPFSTESFNWNINANPTTQFLESEQGALVLSVNVNPTVNIRVVNDLAINVNETASMPRAHEVSDIFVNLLASITMEIQEFESESTHLSGSPSFQNNETPHISINEPLNISFSIRELANIGITVSTSVVFKIAESSQPWQLNATPSASLQINELSEGTQALMGWSIGAFEFFDYVPADESPVDTSGTITMSITVGP